MTTIANLQSALPHINYQPVHIKSKYGAEFRRFSITPLDQSKIRQLIERSNQSGSTLLTSTTPQLPTPRVQKGHNTTNQENKTTVNNLSGNFNNRSSRSNNSSKSNHSKESINEHKKMMRLKGITFKEFQATLAKLHKINLMSDTMKGSSVSLNKDGQASFKIFYTDKKTGTLLPINNDDNLAKAISSCQDQSLSDINPPDTTSLNNFTYSGSNSVLKIYLFNSSQQHSSWLMAKDVKGNTVSTPNFENTNLPEEFISPSTITVTKRGKSGNNKGSNSGLSAISIGSPVNFRPVSAIIDVDVLPESLRRVRLHKHKSDRPLGFFIRDGSSLKMGPTGLEKVPAIFISRLVADGLASMTGLLSVNDEVLEVNGIDVSGKTLDQVTHMMIANSENLIITVKPANQKNNPVRSKSISNNQKNQSQNQQNPNNTSFQHTSFHSNHSNTNKILPPHSSPFSQNSHNKQITRTPIAEPIRSAFHPAGPAEEDDDVDQVKDLKGSAENESQPQPYLSI